MSESKCHCCDNLQDIDSIIWNISNGLTSIPLCKECYEKIAKHVMEIEDMLQLPSWNINIPVEDRYNENIKIR